MKKSIKINLGGLVLHVDDDAYDLLRNYLDQLQSRFSQVPGESEILNDIETRMAELFQEKLIPGKEVINLADVRETIAVMGEPEEIGDTGEGEEIPPVQPPYSHRGRRMFRDPSNQRIAGVCSGLAAYFRMDPVFIRILFIAFTLAYGAGILVYFVLWACVPEARTAAEKLEMYGEPVNVENIERQVRQEYPHDPASPDYQQPVRSNNRGTLIGNLVRGLARIVLVFFKIIGLVIAISLIFAGIVLLGSMIGLAINGKAWFINSDFNLGGIGLGDAVGFFVSPATATIGAIGLVILIAIPLLGLIYGVVKVIFRFRTPDRTGIISLSGIWAVTLVVLIIMCVNEGVRYSTGGVSTVEKELVIPQNKKIIIKALPYETGNHETMAEFNFHSRFWLERKHDSVNLLIQPTVRIEYSPDSTAEIRVRKTARGSHYQDATQIAEKISYSCSMQDSVLVLDPVYRLSQRHRFHAQEVDVTISLPAGTVVYLDRSLKKMLYAVENSEDTWSGDLVGDEWIMTSEGLTRVLKSQSADKKN